MEQQRFSEAESESEPSRQDVLEERSYSEKEAESDSIGQEGSEQQSYSEKTAESEALRHEILEEPYFSEEELESGSLERVNTEEQSYSEEELESAPQQQKKGDKRKTQANLEVLGKSIAKKKTRISNKAGLNLPVSRFRRFLKQGGYTKRIGYGTPIYMAGVIEYLVAEILELAGNAAQDDKKRRITPRHIQLAVRHDDELNKLLEGVTIPSCGVVPCIHSMLLPKPTAKNSGQDKCASRK